MRTSTDEELHGAIRYTQSVGLTPILSPMLDPDYHRFHPMWTRDCSPNPWRGTIGTAFGSDCSAGSLSHQWFTNYRSFLLHYAHLAHEWNVSQFVVTHELYLVNDGWDKNRTGDGPVGHARSAFSLRFWSKPGQDAQDTPPALPHDPPNTLTLHRRCAMQYDPRRPGSCGASRMPGLHTVCGHHPQELRALRPKMVQQAGHARDGLL